MLNMIRGWTLLILYVRGKKVKVIGKCLVGDAKLCLDIVFLVCAFVAGIASQAEDSNLSQASSPF